MYLRVDESPFTPGANTLAYFPLETDQLDATGNYTLSLTGTQQAVGYQFSWSLLTVDWTYIRVHFVNYRAKIDSFGTGISDCATMMNLGTMRYNWINNTDSSASKVFFLQNGSNLTSKSSAQNTTTWTWYNMAYGIDSSNNYKAYLNWNLVWSGSLATVRQPSWSNIMILFNNNTTATFSRIIAETDVWTDQQVLDYFNATKADYWIS